MVIKFMSKLPEINEIFGILFRILILNLCSYVSILRKLQFYKKANAYQHIRKKNNKKIKNFVKHFKLNAFFL